MLSSKFIIFPYSYVTHWIEGKHVRYLLIPTLFEALPNVHFIFMVSYKSNFEAVRVCMGPLMGIHHRVPLWVWIIDKYHQKAQLIFRTTKQRNVFFRHIKIIYWTTCCHDTCAFSGLPISLVMIVKICVFFIGISKSDESTFSPFIGFGHETMVRAVCLPMLKMVVRL